MASTWGRSFSWPNTCPARSGRRSPSRAGRAKSSTPSGRRSLRHSLQPPAFSLQPAPETRRNTEGRRSFRQEDKVQTAADEKWIRMLGSGSGLGERAPSLSATPTRPRRPGKAPQPAPCARKSATRTAQKTALCPPASTQEVSESENRPATRGTAHSEVQGDDRGTARGTDRCSDRPMAALHFLLPTGDSRSGRRSFDSKLISLLPLDDVPVHVHPFAARAPCDSKGSECQCGIHTAEAASALRSRKTERAAKEKPTQISQFF